MTTAARMAMRTTNLLFRYAWHVGGSGRTRGCCGAREATAM
jgi:hypothetical protein